MHTHTHQAWQMIASVGIGLGCWLIVIAFCMYIQERNRNKRE